MDKRLVMLVALAVTVAGFGAYTFYTHQRNSEMDDFNRGVMHYFENPQPDNLPKLARQIAKEGLLEREDTKYNFATFMSQIMARNPEKIAQWTQDLQDLTSSQKRGLWLALWRSETPEAMEQLEKLLATAKGEDKEFLSALIKQKPGPLADPVTSPGDLDLLWSAYFATGDDKFVERIINALAKGNEKGGQNIIIAGAAKWSLTANARQFPSVMRLVEQAQFSKPEIAQDLREIISSAGARSGRE